MAKPLLEQKEAIELKLKSMLTQAGISFLESPLQYQKRPQYGVRVHGSYVGTLRRVSAYEKSKFNRPDALFTFVYKPFPNTIPTKTFFQSSFAAWEYLATKDWGLVSSPSNAAGRAEFEADPLKWEAEAAHG